MIVNRKNTGKERVKFISYTGEYPNLCSGVLTLEIDGVEYKFGHDYRNYHVDENGNWRYTDEDPNNPNFNSFWTSGGSVTGSGPDWEFEVSHDEWEIDVDELPEQFWDVANEINTVINENIPYGCCGGCI